MTEQVVISQVYMRLFQFPGTVLAMDATVHQVSPSVMKPGLTRARKEASTLQSGGTTGEVQQAGHTQDKHLIRS